MPEACSLPPRLIAMYRPIRAILWLGYAVYLGWVAYLVWSTSPAMPGTTISRAVELAASLGIDVSTSQIEFTLNVVMLVPLSLIGGLLFRRLRVADWTTIGFGASLMIEVVQRLALPTRSGSSRDVVANTLGAFLGAALLVLALGIVAQHRHPSGGAASPAPADKMTP